MHWIVFMSSLYTGPILDSEGMGSFFGAHFSEKRAFSLLAFPNQIAFLTISNKNIFFKTRSTRLGAIVTPNKCLEEAQIYALCS